MSENRAPLLAAILSLSLQCLQRPTGCSSGTSLAGPLVDLSFAAQELMVAGKLEQCSSVAMNT